MSEEKEAFASPPCTWLVQATVRGETLQRLEEACAANGNPLHQIRVIPFSTEMPEDLPEVAGPFVFYGYTTLLVNAFKDPRWRRGVFFDPALFRPTVYREKWGAERLLNGDADVLTLREFAAWQVAPTETYFVRPDDDLKRFTGGLMTHGDFRNWYATIATLNGEGDISPETQILVARPKAIGDEWRLFFVDGQLVAHSCYSNEGRDLFLPPEVKEFAKQAVAVWSPAPVFVLDVTRRENGTACIVEANCINGSGFYFADTFAIVRAVSRWQEANW